MERKRRAHINDGIEEISRLIPGGFDKIGKSTLLKRAADYLSEITQRVEKFDDELAKHEMEKANLQVSRANPRSPSWRCSASRLHRAGIHVNVTGES